MRAPAYPPGQARVSGAEQVISGFKVGRWGRRASGVPPVPVGAGCRCAAGDAGNAPASGATQACTGAEHRVLQPDAIADDSRSHQQLSTACHTHSWPQVLQWRPGQCAGLTQATPRACCRAPQVVKALGKGSYGTVYKVVRLASGQEYAMKETDIGRMGSAERQDAGARCWRVCHSPASACRQASCRLHRRLADRAHRLSRSACGCQVAAGHRHPASPRPPLPPRLQ
jgi:hypothetical protein